MKKLIEIKNEMGVDREKVKNLSKSRRKEIKDFYKTNWDIDKTAKEFNLSKSIIYYTIRKLLELKRKEELKSYKKRLDNLTDYEIGYIVGIIEGEGYLGIIKENNIKKRYRLIVSIANRDIRIINKINELIGLEYSIHTFKKLGKIKDIHNKNYQNWGEIFEWKTNDKKVISLLLKKLEPYMISKREEINIMLKLLKNKGKGNYYYNQLQLIKTKKSNHTSLAKKIKMEKY
jgi:predicted DNA-binding protein YlxM (UPF0122 family)